MDPVLFVWATSGLPSMSTWTKKRFSRRTSRATTQPGGKGNKGLDMGLPQVTMEKTPETEKDGRGAGVFPFPRAGRRRFTAPGEPATA